jgi:signal transduction histidine kinase
MTMSSEPGQDTVVPALADASEAAALLDRLEEGVLVLDGSRVAGVNASLARMVGEAPDRIVGRRLQDLVTDPGGRPIAGDASAEAAQLRSANGKAVPISIRRVSPRLLLVVDRSRERMLEQEIWRLSRGSGPGCDRFPEVGLWGEQLAMAEHEIRTAITVVTGYARLLLDERVGPIEPTQRDFLEEVQRAAARVEALLDRLLDLGPEGEATDISGVRKPVSLPDIVRKATTALRPLAEERQVRLVLRLHPDADALHADPLGIEQVVTNLLTNAFKFTPRGSAVCVETGLEEAREGELVWIAVRDEGPGVDPDEVTRVFQPFFCGRAAMGSESPGVGLGLAVCRTIVEAHGGSIEAVPSSGGGLFRVTLPVES